MPQTDTSKRTIIGILFVEYSKKMRALSICNHKTSSGTTVDHLFCILAQDAKVHTANCDIF